MVISDILNKEVFHNKIQSKFSPSVDCFTHVKIGFNSNGGRHHKVLGPPYPEGRGHWGSQVIFSCQIDLDINEPSSLLQIRLINCLNEYQNVEYWFCLI